MIASTGIHDSASSQAWHLTELITRLRRVLRAGVRREIPWESLPMAQIEILQRLADEPAIRISDLAARHHLATNTVSTLVNRMSAHGLIERSRDPNDRRATTLTMTASGMSRLNDWLEANEVRVDRALHELSRAQQRSIIQALPALAELAARLEHHEVG